MSQKIRIGYLGPEGTFSEEAVYRYLAGREAIPIAFPSLADILTAHAQGDLEEGILPLENSCEGSVNITLDLLAHHFSVKIKDEIILPVNNNLLAHPGTKLSDLRKILSHPQPLAQCRDFLNKNFPGLPLTEVSSTAEAARLVARSKEPWAAIGTKRAATLNNLVILVPSINDHLENYTRFIVISSKDHPLCENCKTSIILSLIDRPGALYQVLKEFAERNINLTKIESRPSKKKLGEYLFFIDFTGHRSTPEASEALEAIKSQSTWLKILGSYPVDKLIGV